MLSSFPNQSSLRYRRLLVVIKQTAYEEYSQLKLRGQAPKALRWKRLESRYKAHKKCVNDLLTVLRQHDINFSCVNRVEMDRQHLADVDLVVAVGGDGTVLSAAHFLDHGTIPLLGVNSDPISMEETESVKKKSDERRSHGALCMCTSQNMHKELPKVFYGGGNLASRYRIQCIVKSTFSETRLVPGLNDILICHPSPAAVSRFRMGWLEPAVLPDSKNDGNSNNSSTLEESSSVTNQMGDITSNQIPPQNESVITDANNKVNNNNNNNNNNTNQFLFPNSFTENGLRGSTIPNFQRHTPSEQYGTVTRFGGIPFDVTKSLNAWSSGIWICTSTGASAAMHAAGGQDMDPESTELQYLIREHMLEARAGQDVKDMNNKMLGDDEQLHMRWNSHKGRIYIDGSHLTHDLELGDEILINNKAPPLKLFLRDEEK